jgi:hypothetical protein
MPAMPCDDQRNSGSLSPQPSLELLHNQRAILYEHIDLETEFVKWTIRERVKRHVGAHIPAPTSAATSIKLSMNFILSAELLLQAFSLTKKFLIVSDKCGE